jgi:dihydroorotase
MSGALTLPGLIDCHVHFRDPGLTHKEDFESGMRAALAGGITTVCDMPNTNPPTRTMSALQEKIERARRVGNPKSQIPNPKCDIRFFFGVTQRRHLRELEEVMKREELKKYVPGVKLYLEQSTGDQMIEEETIEEVFRTCAERGLMLVCHCEDEEIIQRNIALRGPARLTEVQARLGKPRSTKQCGAPQGDVRMKAHSEIRSVEAAVKATTKVIELAKKYETKLHIAHLSTADELELVRKAKMDEIAVTCEVAPHHLFLTIEDYASLGTLAKMNPPLRMKRHLEALWEGVLDGSVDCIASDHAPHTLEEKRSGPPLEAPSGVPGVETMLPLILSCVFGDGPVDSTGVRRMPGSRRLNIENVRRLLFNNPNRIFGLGRNPDLPPFIHIDPEEEWVIQGKDLKSKCGWTPYEGWVVRGKAIEHRG